MTIKLLLLKSGEDIIADLAEMNVGDEENPRVVGYYLRKPCIVKLQEGGTQLLTEEDNQVEQNKYSLKMFPWMPLSADEVVPIPTDWVVTIVKPVEQVFKMYTEEVLKNESDNSDESDNSSSKG